MGYIAMQSVYHAHWAVIHWICMVGAGAIHGVVRHHGALHMGALSHGARTVRARCAHGSMFLGWLPNLYPVEWPP